MNNNNFQNTNGSYNGNSQGNVFASSGQENNNDPDEIDLKQLFYLLYNRKWVIIATVAICTLLAGIFAFTATPIYQSKGSILISQQQNSLSAGSDGLASMLSSTYGIGTGSTVANELQVLRSRKLSNKMADSLMEQRLMKNGRQYPVLFRSYPDDSTITTQDTVAMRIRENISFSQTDREADMVSISYASPSPREAANMISLSMELYTELSTSQNRQSANSAVSFLEKERSRIKDQLKDVEERLRTFMNKERLMQVDAQTEELIKRMAELESKKQEAKVTLVATNSAIEQYKERLNSIKPGLAEQYADAIGPNMTRLQYKLAELEMEKLQILANNPSFKNQEDPPRKLKKLNDEIKVYRERINNLTANLVKEGDQYLGFLGGADGNIAEAVTDLNKKLIELQVQQQQAQAQMEVIDEQLNEQQRFFKDLPDNMIALARRKRDVKINEELYLTVSKQYAEMSLWKQTQFGLGRPVDTGYIPKEPIKPNKKLYLLVGFILGGILSVGYIFTQEAFNTKIDGVEKLKKYDSPLLAVIPDLTPRKEKEYGGQAFTDVNGTTISTDMITLLDTISPPAESFRRLQTNILYSNPDEQLDTLMITSASKGEGKSTVSANLAVVLAEAGKEVVIVDTDLRRPNAHNMFGLRRSPGITEVLFDDKPWQDAVQETLRARVSLLSAGMEAPNPSAVTQSGAFLSLIEELQQAYDFVLLDTAPFGIITDASALISHTDGVVVVNRFNETTEVELDHVLGNLRHLNAHVIGTVLTAFDYEQTSDAYYNSSYYREAQMDYSSY